LLDINGILIFSVDFRKLLLHKIELESVYGETSCSVQTDGKTNRSTRRN